MYFTLYANEKDELLEYPAITMLGRTGGGWVEPVTDEMIPLPKGASLVTIPDHIPVGLDACEKLTHFKSDLSGSGRQAFAVAALLPQGFTRVLLPACVNTRSGKNLPLFGYAAVGMKQGQVYVAAVQTDQHRKWHPAFYNTERLPVRIDRMLKKFPHNRIMRQLSHCALQYGCFTAQNIFYGRWEGGIPTTPTCNADCIGCISENHSGVNSPQERLAFSPEVNEIVELGVHHLANAREAIISFGQGCEGEPSLSAIKLSESIRQMRCITDQGTININTNAGYTAGIKQMVEAGLDAMRVTLFSFNEDNYNRYHRPRGYSIKDVRESITVALDNGVQVSLNLLTFPGFTDRESEIGALMDFVHKYPVFMIQLRNLNIDPDFFQQHFAQEELGIGIITMLNILAQEAPAVKVGSYTHPVGVNGRR
ncbi:MAG: radical SAM protein [Syntrophomonadaceae bacterium]|nr:radical SAM protein [Syntrophomonadaceae bacterium]